MKILTYTLILFLTCCQANSQPVQNPKKKGIPPFSIQLVTGQTFKAADLKKDKPLMIVYFDPDCDHCHAFIDGLIKNISLFSNDQIVLISYVPIQEVKKYTETSGLSKYPQLTIGTEGTAYIVRYFFDIVQFPYVALYDSKGNLIATYESVVPPPGDLSRLLR